MNLKKMTNKGQGAMEYLMTYGWAILVVMIVGVVLWQLGIFNPPTSTVLKGWTVLQPLSPSISFKSTPTQDFIGSFNNAVGTSIRITDVAVNEVLGPCGCVDTADDIGVATTTINGAAYSGSSASPAQTATVAAGSAFSVATQCLTDISGTGVCGSTRARNDPYEINMTVSYSSVIGGIVTPHTEVGTIRGMVE